MKEKLRALIDEYELWREDGADGYNVAADHLVDALIALLSTPKPEATEGGEHEKGHLGLVGEVHAMNDGFGDRPIWFDYQPIVGTKLYAYRAALTAKPDTDGREVK